MSASENAASAFFADGRRAALAGAPRDQNPALARPASTSGVPDSDELWAVKKDAWSRGWEDGDACRKQIDALKPD